MKFGFEVEFFCRTPITGDDPASGAYCLVPSSIPKDDCGWLAEVRSEPHQDIRKAIALLKAEISLVCRQASKAGVLVVQEPLGKIPRELIAKAARLSNKDAVRYQNIYDHETHRHRIDFAPAATHVSFTNEHVKTFTKKTYTVDGKFIRAETTTEEFKYQGFIDHAKLIVGLDRAFAAEIKAAQRNPGFYEVKSDGRIEYRSLPNNVDFEKLGDVLETLTKGLC